MIGCDSQTPDTLSTALYVELDDYMIGSGRL